MAKTFSCDIVSASSQIYSGTIELLVATGESGELGICFGHTPLLTRLIPGPIRVLENTGDEHVYYVSGGFLEVQANLVTVLADVAMRGYDIDEDAAETARKDAQDIIANQHGDIDYGLAATQLAQATAQLATLRKIKNRAKRG